MTPLETRSIGLARLWPVAIVGVLALTVGANGYLLYRASDAPMPLERDYYRKAVAWDSAMTQAAENTELGWEIEASLDDAGHLEVLIRDRAGTPILDATVSVDGFPIAYGDGEFSARLESGAGQYTATAPIRRAGQHELRFVAVRGGDRFTAALRGWPGAAFTRIR